MSTNTSSIESLLTIIKNLEQKVDTLTTNQTQQKPAYKPNEDTFNPRTGKPWKRYCWSCGYVSHLGKHCPYKKQGHKDEATFKSRMGGNNLNYFPIKK